MDNMNMANIIDNIRRTKMSLEDIEFGPTRVNVVCKNVVLYVIFVGRYLNVVCRWFNVWAHLRHVLFMLLVENHIPIIYSNIEWGSSRNFLKCCNHWAPTAPSTVRWSQLSVTVVKSLFFQPFSDVASGTIRSWVPPTARMHDCGGLMTAQKWVTPEGKYYFRIVKKKPLVLNSTHQTCPDSTR